MDREQMVEQAVAAMLTVYISEDQKPFRIDYEVANKILDAILPQITTVEELEALPARAGLLSEGGEFFRAPIGRDQCLCLGGPARHLPLTVVWRP